MCKCEGGRRGCRQDYPTTGVTRTVGGFGVGGVELGVDVPQHVDRVTDRHVVRLERGNGDGRSGSGDAGCCDQCDSYSASRRRESRRPANLIGLAEGGGDEGRHLDGVELPRVGGADQLRQDVIAEAKSRL